jgi:hypothetical protein
MIVHEELPIFFSIVVLHLHFLNRVNILVRRHGLPLIPPIHPFHNFGDHRLLCCPRYPRDQGVLHHLMGKDSILRRKSILLQILRNRFVEGNQVLRKQEKHPSTEQRSQDCAESELKCRGEVNFSENDVEEELQELVPNLILPRIYGRISWMLARVL